MNRFPSCFWKNAVQTPHYKKQSQFQSDTEALDFVKEGEVNLLIIGRWKNSRLLRSTSVRPTDSMEWVSITQASSQPRFPISCIICSQLGTALDPIVWLLAVTACSITLPSNLAVLSSIRETGFSKNHKAFMVVGVKSWLLGSKNWKQYNKE